MTHLPQHVPSSLPHTFHFLFFFSLQWLLVTLLSYTTERGPGQASLLLGKSVKERYAIFTGLYGLVSVQALPCFVG